MSTIKVNLDGLDSSALQIKTVASALDDLKLSMNGVFSSIDPKIKRRRNIDGSIADIQKKMQMLYTEMNELSRFISSSKNQYANAEARLAQMSNDYTNRISNFLAESADVGVCAAAGVSPADKVKEKSASESWLERVGDAVTGKAKNFLERFLKQAGGLIVNVGSKILSGIEGIAVSSVLNYVEGFSNIGFGIAEFFHFVPGTTARYEFKHDLDAFQATIADKYVLDKKWYYGGRAVGDIISFMVGTKMTAEGLKTIASGITIAAMGVGASATGGGVVVGVPAIAVSGVAVAAGALETAIGVSVSAVSVKSFNDDFAKFQQEGQAEGKLDKIGKKNIFGLDSSKPMKVSELRDYAKSQGWTKIQSATVPEKWVDENGIARITIKEGSVRTPGSEKPHVEIRDSSGQRIDPFGNPVNRRSEGNHTQIEYDTKNQ